jgi:CBS domain-containing protein
MRRTGASARVHDVMTCLVASAPPAASLERVAELLAMLLADALPGAVPIVGEDGLLLGMVTEADLLRDPGPRPPVAAAVMSAPLVVVGDGQSVSEAQSLLTRHGIHHLPVVDRAGRLVGMISRDDVMAALGEDEAGLRSAIVGLVHECGGSIAALDVSEGVVHLHARVPDVRTAHTLEQRVRITPGVRVLIPAMEYGGELCGRARAPAGRAERGGTASSSAG